MRLQSDATEIPSPPILHEKLPPQPILRTSLLKKAWSHVDLFAGFASFWTFAFKDGLLDKDESRPVRNQEIRDAGRSALLLMWGIGMWKQAHPNLLSEVSSTRDSWHFDVEPVFEEKKVSAKVVFWRRF